MRQIYSRGGVKGEDRTCEKASAPVGFSSRLNGRAVHTLRPPPVLVSPCVYLELPFSSSLLESPVSPVTFPPAHYACVCIRVRLLSQFKLGLTTQC